MFWTKIKPTKPGLYWIKFIDPAGNKCTLITQVLLADNVLTFSLPANVTDIYWSDSAIPVPVDSNIIQFPIKDKSTKDNK
jgi:hypothetical protein